MIRAAAREQVSAGGLALLVHLFFFVMLIFGVSWKTLPEAPVYADLWRALPARPVPLPPQPPEMPEPAPPKIKPAPPPPPPPPKAEPVRQTAKPDIALQEKKAREAERERQEKLRAEEARRREEALKQQRAEEDRLRQEAERRRRLEDELARAERERLLQEEQALRKRQEEARQAAEAKRQAQERLRKQMEAMLAAEMDERLAEEAEVIRHQEVVSSRLKLVEDYKSRIQMKVKYYVANPPGLRGKPEAVYQVDLLPNGEVVRATLLKSSGQPAYDRAVESAILKSSPFPLPPDREAAVAFRDGLELKFRPD